MTDIVEMLRQTLVGEDTDEAMWARIARARREAANEIERLRAALMRVLQYENKCDQTGAPCREPARCSCYLESETWFHD